MLRNTRAQMAAILAAGALLGYLAASGELKSLARSFATVPAAQADKAKTGGPENGDQPACCQVGNKGHLLALADDRTSRPVSTNGKKPNIVMLMQDDTGWFDFGCYGGGASLGHPTPNVDRMAKEGARFSSWYGQASCTAGRCS